MLTNELIEVLLKTSNEIEFAVTIFDNKIDISEWQNNQQLYEHFEKVKKRTRERMFSSETDVPREMRLYHMNQRL